VLDEADRMLDMGFVRDVEKVLRELPRQRQSALFSATLPESIIRLSGKYLHDPVKVAVTPEEPTLDAITQVLYYLERPDKRRLLAELLQDPDVDRAIVFVRTKHGANRLVKQLDRAGIESRAIHGNKSQGARTRALDGFQDGSVPVLVATDVAARGIDVDGVSHVIQVDLPNEPEVYVHRIGRTGRAGRDGIAICFCDSTETDQLRQIERLTGRPIRPVTDHPWHSDQAMEQRDEADRRSTRGRPKKKSGGRNRGGGRRGGGGGGQQGGSRSGGGNQGGGGGPPRRKRRPRR